MYRWIIESVTPFYNKGKGRFFIYDNNNKILVYSSNPIKKSERDDRTKPLIDMDLRDEKPYR